MSTGEIKVRKGFSAGSLVATILAVIALFGIGWSAFVKPTTTNNVDKGGSLTQVYNYDVPKIPLLSGGCSRIKAQLFWQLDPKDVKGNIKDKK